MSHIKRQENIVKDCLCRPAKAIKIDLDDLQEILKQQSIDEEIQSQLKPYHTHGN